MKQLTKEEIEDQIKGLDNPHEIRDLEFFCDDLANNRLAEIARKKITDNKPSETRPSSAIPNI